MPRGTDGQVTDKNLRNDSLEVRDEKEKLNRQIISITASIGEAHGRAHSVEDLRELRDNLLNSVKSWLPMK